MRNEVGGAFAALQFTAMPVALEGIRYRRWSISRGIAFPLLALRSVATRRASQVEPEKSYRVVVVEHAIK